MNYDIGAIWRKWDLHIHTPASFHWNGGSRFAKMGATEKSKALNEIAKTIEESDIAAFAIMDYWTFDGYITLRDHIRANFSKFQKAVFPGIELRVEAPVDFRLNIHVILSDLLSNQQIQDLKCAPDRGQ